MWKTSSTTRATTCPRWVNTTPHRLGIPYDIPIPGYGTNTVNFLRLWESRPSEKINLEAFNRGGYSEALADKTQSETVSKVLYPNDKTEAGKELRLDPAVFLRLVLPARHHPPLPQAPAARGAEFPDKVAIQLNDTHPALAVVELLRILHDEQRLPWDEAWGIVTRTHGLHESHAAARGAGKMERAALPARPAAPPAAHFRDQPPPARERRGGLSRRRAKEAQHVADRGRRRQRVRMANLAVVGSHSVNGVAALHTELLKKHLFCTTSTSFIPASSTTRPTASRRAAGCRRPIRGSPRSDHLQDRRRLDQATSTSCASSSSGPTIPQFQHEFMAIKHANKVDLAHIIQRECGVTVNPDALFDVQIKRLHEYKRQHLNLLHILALYRRILQNPTLDIQPRVFIFAAKAAPGYDLAKCIIKAINAVGAKINNDPRVGDKLKVVFLPNYRVSLAQRIIPAADLSEQISTAGKEASGTGNMKLALNGALTIGTLDGANVEILEEVGPDNIFIFGMTVNEVDALVAQGLQPARTTISRTRNCAPCVDWVGSNYFTPDEPGALAPLQNSLIHGRRPLPRPGRFPRLQRGPGEGRRGLPRQSRAGPRWPSSTPRASASSPATAPSTSTPARSGTCRRCACKATERSRPAGAIRSNG